jgi:hypothetical protein
MLVEAFDLMLRRVFVDWKLDGTVCVCTSCSPHWLADDAHVNSGWDARMHSSSNPLTLGLRALQATVQAYSCRLWPFAAVYETERTLQTLQLDRFKFSLVF